MVEFIVVLCLMMVGCLIFMALMWSVCDFGWVRTTLGASAIVWLLWVLSGCATLTDVQAKAVVDCTEEYIEGRYTELEDVVIIHKKADRCLDSCAFYQANIMYIDYTDAWDYGVQQAYLRYVEDMGFPQYFLTYESQLMMIVLHEYGHIYEFKIGGMPKLEFQATMFAFANAKETIKYCEDKGVKVK